MAFAETRGSGAAAAAATRETHALLELIRRAAGDAARVIRDAEPKRALLAWREKDVADFVTDVDVAAEARIIEVLRAGEPGAGIVAEESAATAISETAALQFVIDPLDGTTNFIHGLPEYAVSIAAVVNGEPVAGIVLNVARDEWFTAVAGGGAWLGDQPLRVSEIATPTRALIGTGFPFKTPAEIPHYIGQLTRVMTGVAGIRRPGAASIDLASVAAGRFEAFWENFLSPWDIAAGLLLVREAGGICTDIDGRPLRVAFGSVVAGNPAMHAWLLNAINPAVNSAINPADNSAVQPANNPPQTPGTA